MTGRKPTVEYLWLVLVFVSASTRAEGANRPHLWDEPGGTVPVSLDSATWPDVWELARRCQVVAIGRVRKVEANVGLVVRRVLKGRPTGELITFPAPPAPALPEAGQIRCPRSRVLKFAVGEEWLVFLQPGELSSYTLVDAFPGNMPAAERTVKDVLVLDSLPNARAKCEMLVRLACSDMGLFSGLVARELSKCNEPEFLDLLAPLGQKPVWKAVYIGLLRDNASPQATQVLRGYLGCEDGSLLWATISALGRKAPRDEGLSRDLLAHLTHDDPLIRGTVIFALSQRENAFVFPAVAKCLDDPDPMVRASALGDPWYGHAREDPAVMEKVRQLTGDPDQRVRANACGALVSLREVGSFYSLWSAALLDPSRLVRGAIHLDLLFEHAPVIVCFLIYWPTVLLGVVIFLARRPRSLNRRLTVFLGGAVGGYVVGAIGGYLVGKYHADNPVFQAFVLMPALLMPVGILLLLALHAIGRKGPTT